MPDGADFTLALDQGTLSSRALLFDGDGRLVHAEQQSITLKRIDRHRVEQDPGEILGSMQSVLGACLRNCSIPVSKISAAGLATQRSSIVAWRPSDGQVLSPVLSWQDTRGHEWLTRFEHEASRIERITGLRLSPHYGVSKIAYLLEHDEAVAQQVARGDCVITPLASFLLYHLTDARSPLIDIPNACRTLLCDLSTADWSRELLDLFGIDAHRLPSCRPVRADYGWLRDVGIPLRAVNGDQTAALYCDGEPATDRLQVNLGSGAFVLTPIDEQQVQATGIKSSRLLTGIAYSDANRIDYIIEGTVNGAAAALDWLCRQHGLPAHSRPGGESFEAQPSLVFINAIGGLGSPLWRSDIDPIFLDLNGQPVTPSFDQAYIAVLESIAFLLQLNIQRMRQLKPRLTGMDTSGGLSQLDYLNQVLADLVGLPVERREQVEATARGIAWLAGDQSSTWSDSGIDKHWLPRDNRRLQERFEVFRRFIEQR
jgi:glycerol kinase